MEEATITGVHRAFRAKKLTATELVSRYFERIRAHNGVCVGGDVDAATGLHLGDITPIPNAGQLNAFITLNLKEDKRIKLGFPEKLKRTHTGRDDGKFPDALDRARELDRYFARTGKFAGPLHGIPIAIKDNYDTFDMRTTAAAAAQYADDRPPDDATMVVKLRAAGAILLGKTNMDEYAPAGIARSAQSLRYDEDTRGIERRLGRGGGGQPRHVRPGHGHIRFGALSVIVLQPGRPGRDPRAGEPRRHRAAVIYQGPRRPDLPHRRRHGDPSRSSRRLRSQRSGHGRLRRAAEAFVCALYRWKIAARKKAGRAAWI
ncbi:MAG: hypothetical protein E6J74_08625 [Deltaproteobacteria bacterium]|nr:MAG: hypothetical protein E6J74_08625 [Deltaproteobacteria bacterium]